MKQLWICLVLLASSAVAQSWRSVLYPENWLPLDAGGKAIDGKFLHDFSYAGYRLGDVPIPQNPGRTERTLERSFADGKTDATKEIQDSLNALCATGGGVLNLPAGTFRIKPPRLEEGGYTLNLPCSQLVLRGALDAAGNPTSFLFNDQPNMRGMAVIRVSPKEVRGNWYSGNVEGNKVGIARDLLEPTREIPVSSVNGYAVGDSIMIRSDVTEAFRAEHGMQGLWPNRPGPLYRREIRSIRGNTLLIDEPTRYPIKMRDGARVIKLRGEVVSDSGVENLFIGMRENLGNGLGDDDYDREGTAAYQMDRASLIQFHWAENVWAKNIRSYKPAGNTKDVQLLSIGIHSTNSTRSVSVEDCELANPQYKGGGGNGYLFWIQGQGGLWKNNSASGGRHNFTFSRMQASGNVLLRNTSANSRLVDDFHDTLSHANLIDNHTLIGVQFSANNRGEKSSGAGHTASQNVFWRTRGQAYQTSGAESPNAILDSHQFGVGYVIGTFGSASAVNADGFVEGVGRGESMAVQSLYEDQKAKRGLRK